MNEVCYFIPLGPGSNQTKLRTAMEATWLKRAKSYWFVYFHEDGTDQCLEACLCCNFKLYNLKRGCQFNRDHNSPSPLNVPGELVNTGFALSRVFTFALLYQHKA
eukprot:6813157-Pyramimonas_sp.AAC.1